MAIESVLMQKTSFRFELVIGEDCSTDKTREIVLNYKEKNSEILRLVLSESNQGMMKNALNTSLACSGKYIAILEGDDYWTDPYKLQKQVNFLDSNLDYGLVWTDVDFYSQSTGKFTKAVFKNKKLSIFNSFSDTLINKPFFAPPTWLFRREYLPSGMEDYCDCTFPMILDILAKTRIKYIDEVTATYRQLDESASNSKSPLKRYKFLNGVHRIQKDYIKKYNISHEIEDEIDFRYFKASYPYAVILDDKVNCAEGKLFLNNTTREDKKVKLILLLSVFYLGNLMLKFIYGNTFLKKLAAKLAIFR
jgi:glucosyltransferase